MPDSPQSRPGPGRQRVLGGLLARLRPHWRREPGLPSRIETLLRDRRFGSRDRRLYRELIYTALRFLPWVEPRLASDPEEAVRALILLSGDPAAAALAGAEGGPPPPRTLAEKAAALGADPAELLPAWLRSECPEVLEPAQVEALLSRAPLWLRLRSAADSAEALAELSRRGWDPRPAGLLPLAVRAATGADATATEAWARGAFEVQDLGSQFVLESAGIASGGRWLDACAGAGGKTLQLAALLGPEGRIEARDTRPAALEELARRARRAGVDGQIEIRSPGDRSPARDRAEPARSEFDGVLLDVPCSGSGTWRRSPHLQWCTTPGRLAALAARQRALLEANAPFVRSGGRLVYATCSFCRSENEAVVAGFLAAHPEFSARPPARPFTGRPHGPGLLFLPADHDGDAFFVASMIRR